MKNLNILIALAVHLILASCGEPAATEPAKTDYTHTGDSVINATFDALRNALTAAMRDKGAAGAVAFCNEKAYAITSTYASGNIIINRVAEKYRNPQNAPDSADALQWQRFASAKANGEPLQPALVEEKNIVHYYKPILLQPACAACHGVKNKDILPLVLSTIDSLYPHDRATGFAPGDLRGMWKVSFVRNAGRIP
ncbi:DUF3365 domain-containing protein [Agriterribacter sp.]|uniref:Tll0287-like domain-containing protein n=1 Tax=Agriterribacter sp. TaxID=2821509 RepID=UPI002B8B4FCD|nr:DUF3365 domain-containing protein [Agriterribacter sp.]HRP55535.1 DUF3365 domain-containing protein [Agriterribacter sp.]